MDWWSTRQWRGRKQQRSGLPLISDPAVPGILFALLVIAGYAALKQGISTRQSSSDQQHDLPVARDIAPDARAEQLLSVESEQPAIAGPASSSVPRKHEQVQDVVADQAPERLEIPLPAPELVPVAIPMRRPDVQARSREQADPASALAQFRPFHDRSTQFDSHLRPRVSRKRMFIAQALTLSGGFMVYRKFQQYFGGVAQPFRIGSDWTKDNAMYFDELLHFQGSYRLAQAIGRAYHWAGIRTASAEIAGALVAATTMTFLEYIDGRRPNDEASYSDFTANFLGITFALLKPRVPLFEKVDFHISYRDFRDPLTARKLLDYGRITHWMTYDLSDRFAFPLEVGLGYAVHNAFTEDVRPHLRIGVGVGLAKLLRMKNSRLARPLQWLDVYQLGLQVQVL